MPEHAIQYYRASSVVLTLDGYNNTVVFENDPTQLPAALPANVDTNLMKCVNETIGTSVPLAGGTHLSYHAPSNFILVGFFCIIWWLGRL